MECNMNVSNSNLNASSWGYQPCQCCCMCCPYRMQRPYYPVYPYYPWGIWGGAGGTSVGGTSQSIPTNQTTGKL